MGSADRPAARVRVLGWARERKEPMMTADGYALLVVDMQNGFCHPDGSFPRIGRGLEGAMDAVRTASVAVGQARRGGLPVVFTRHVYRPGRPDEGAALLRNSPET